MHKNQKLRIKNQERRSGFTLLEMVVSIGIFTFIVVAAIGIMLAVAEAQVKASNLQIVQDNARFGLELMTKELRTGSGYRLSAICGNLGEEISFFTATGASRIYYKSGNSLLRLAGSVDCARALTFIGNDAVLESVRFRIGGEDAGATDGQPWVLISLSVRSADANQSLESHARIQTVVTARARDL